MDVVDRTLKNFFLSTGVSYKIPSSDVTYITIEAKNQLMKDKVLLELTSPIIVVGDLHGFLIDLLHIFKNCALPPDNKFLFLGDYIDRGPSSVETLCLLLALKVKYPKHIYLLRGNHESREMAETNTFGKECAQKLFPSALTLFSEVFDVMPVAAVIDTKIFCIHAGLSKGFMKLSDIKKIRRPFSLPETGPLADLFWSDPAHNVQDWGPSQRGNTFVWGLKVAKQFMEENNLIQIVRAHQVVYEGYGFPFFPDKSVVTIYSASSSANGSKNFAAYIHILPNAPPKYIQLAQLPRSASFGIFWKDAPSPR